MPAPHTPRGLQQGQARALNRGAKGMGGGKYAGTSPARPRAARVTRNDTPPTELSVPNSYESYSRTSQVVAGSAVLDMSIAGGGSLMDTFGDTGWLNDNGDGSWSIGEAGLYEIHIGCRATTTRAAGNCVTLERIVGFDFPITGALIRIPFLGIAGSVTSLLSAEDVVVKTVTQVEIDGVGSPGVTFEPTYLGGAGTLSSYMTVVKVL